LIPATSLNIIFQDSRGYISAIIGSRQTVVFSSHKQYYDGDFFVGVNLQATSLSSHRRRPLWRAISLLRELLLVTCRKATTPAVIGESIVRILPRISVTGIDVYVCVSVQW
jgi:hypothetical protein